ncbi:MAG: hypothetical protein Q9227_004753 [Pyrenula ochraceoflavens]
MGTLMVPAVMYRVIYHEPKPSAEIRARTTFRPAMLHGYRRRHVRYADYPGLTKDEENPANAVRGSYVTGLTDNDIRYLDYFEGSQYRRDKVKVRLLQGVGLTDSADTSGAQEAEEVEAEVYVFVAGEDCLEPGEWDFEEFKREKSRYWSGEEYIEEEDEGFQGPVNSGYVENLRAQEAKEAADPMGGRGPNGHIGKELEAEHAKDKTGVGDKAH